MTKLYVANATQQIQMFAYWMPESEASRPFYQEIPIGGQVQVPRPGAELSQPAIDGILHQHQMYGIKSVADALKAREFSGIVYSVDRPVKYDALLQLVDKFRGLLWERSKQLRTDAAIATDQGIQDLMFREQIPGRLENLEVSVEEINRDQRDESPEVSDGVRVRRDANPDGTIQERPRMRRRRGTRVAG